MNKLNELKDKLEGEGYQFHQPRLSLGTKQPDGSIRPTGRQVVKFLAEPTLEMRPHPHTKIERQVVLFQVEHRNGETYEWDFEVFQKRNGKPAPHYLIQRLQDVKVGEWLALEMKNAGTKKYIVVEYPLKNGTSHQAQTEDIFDAEEEVNLDFLNSEQDNE